MPFSITWHTILEQLEEVPADATFVTPLSDRPFKLEDIQEHRLIISYRDQNTTLPLKRTQFEQLYDRVDDAHQGFNLDRLPADAEPYATMLSIHPQFEVDQREGDLRNTETPLHLRLSTLRSMSKTTPKLVRNLICHSILIPCFLSTPSNDTIRLTSRNGNLRAG